jgi:hypothetical protein
MATKSRSSITELQAVQVLVDMMAGDILATVATVAMVATVTWATVKVMVLAMVQDMAVVAIVVAIAATLYPLPQVTLMLPMA